VNRPDLKAILRDPARRRRLMVDCIVATQAREGIQNPVLSGRVARDARTDRAGDQKSVGREPVRTSLRLFALLSMYGCGVVDRKNGFHPFQVTLSLILLVGLFMLIRSREEAHRD